MERTQVLEIKRLSDVSSKEHSGRSFDAHIRAQLSDDNALAEFVPLVFVKVKLYAVTAIETATSTCKVDAVIMLDWLDPSLASAMEDHDVMPAHYSLKDNGHFIPKFDIHNAVEATDTFGTPRLDKHGWKMGHAKITKR